MKFCLLTANFNFSILKWLLLLVILFNLMPTPPVPAEFAVTGKWFEHNDNLQAETDALLPLFEQMPSVPVYLKDEQILNSGTNTEHGVAYTNCERHEFPTIFVKKTFFEKANKKQLTNILKHELTHAWLCRQQIMSGHDEQFRQKFKQVGGFGN